MLWWLIVAVSLMHARTFLTVDPYASQTYISVVENHNHSGPLMMGNATFSSLNYLQAAREIPKTRKKELAIFYNIFISPKDVDNSLAIVQEQLDFREAHPNLANVTLYYAKIGAQHVQLPRRCDPCEELTSVRYGSELTTLRYLYQYCQDQPLTGRVVYIHDKGSFTNTPRNRKLRVALTRGAFSEECTEMPSESDDSRDKCDICSAQFSVFPTPHTPGNMFVADCDYIVKLMPPSKYIKAKEALVFNFWNSTWESLGLPPYPNLGEKREQLYKKGWMGIERFALEQWAYSHPSVRPCDVFHERYHYQRPPPHPRKLIAERQMAPQGNSSLTDIEIFHPWFRLPARLYEYRALYSQVPPNNSWVYRAYPPL